jgi:hypothetical protein
MAHRAAGFRVVEPVVGQDIAVGVFGTAGDTIAGAAILIPGRSFGPQVV